MTQATEHQYWMRQAIQLAHTAETQDEVPVAALIVDKNNQCLAKAHNLTINKADATAHAEIIVIRQAGQKLQQARLIDCTLYVTLEPCAMCAGAIVQARLSRVVFAAYDPKMGALAHGIRLFDQPSCNHTPEVIGGVCESAAKKQLQQFFLRRR